MLTRRDQPRNFIVNHAILTRVLAFTLFRPERTAEARIDFSVLLDFLLLMGVFVVLLLVVLVVVVVVVFVVVVVWLVGWLV